MALRAKPQVVSITSYNEWGEGTQIEPAVVKMDSETGLPYADYGTGQENMYMQLTKTMAQQLTEINAAGAWNNGFCQSADGLGRPEL